MLRPAGTRCSVTLVPAIHHEYRVTYRRAPLRPTLSRLADRDASTQPSGIATTGVSRPVTDAGSAPVGCWSIADASGALDGESSHGVPALRRDGDGLLRAAVDCAPRRYVEQTNDVSAERDVASGDDARVG